MKRGKISKVETFYIEQNRDKTVEQLAKDLDRSTDFVRKIISVIPTAEVQPEPPVDSRNLVAPTTPPEQRKMNRKKECQAIDEMQAGMVMHPNELQEQRQIVRAGAIVGAVMTPAQSATADHNRKSSARDSRSTKDAVIRPMGDGYRPRKTR